MSSTLHSTHSQQYWQIAQLILWIIGVAMLFFLIFYPTIGIHLFWNILIPVAPALLVVASGLWRNICPMASTALASNHLNISKRKKLTKLQSSILYLIAVISLYMIVPLRHVIFNLNGPATALLIIYLALLATTLGSIYKDKSAWCSSLCPIHPVEKLYGGLNNKVLLSNAHCTTCTNCTAPCPDSVSNTKPLSSNANSYRRFADLLMIGGFPGFIWGWFQVPDYATVPSFEVILLSYKLPLIGFITSMGLFLLLKKYVEEKTLIAYFAAAAVSLYYWFRIPALFGFGIFPDDGVLINLSNTIPSYYMDITIILTTVFFFWWIVFSKQKRISWMARPKMASKN